MFTERETEFLREGDSDTMSDFFTSAEPECVASSKPLLLTRDSEGLIRVRYTPVDSKTGIFYLLYEKVMNDSDKIIGGKYELPSRTWVATYDLDEAHCSDFEEAAERYQHLVAGFVSGELHEELDE